MAKRKPKVDPDVLVRREAFCQAYVRTGVGTTAAREAGYKGSDTSMATRASRLLRKVNVQDRIMDLRTELAVKGEALRDEMIAELRKHIQFDPTPLVDTFDEGRNTRRLIVKPREEWSREALKYADITVKPGQFGDSVSCKAGADKVRAIVALAQLCGLMVEKHTHEVGKKTLEELLDAANQLQKKDPNGGS